MTFQINQRFISDSRATLVNNFQFDGSVAIQGVKSVVSEARLSELAQAAQAINALEDESSFGFQVINELIAHEESGQRSGQQDQGDENRGNALGNGQAEQREGVIARSEESGQQQMQQEQDELVNSGLSISSRRLETVQEIIDLAGGPRSNPVEEASIVEYAPHGSYLENHAKKGQAGANRTPNPVVTQMSAAEKTVELVKDVVTDGIKVGVEHGAGSSEHDDASMLYQMGRVAVAATAGALVGGPVAIFSTAGLAGLSVAAGVYKVLGWLGDVAEQGQEARRERIANANKMEDPLKDSIDQNDLVGTRDYDLKMQILKNYDPAVDPSEESADSAIYKIIEDIEVIKGMDLFHGGTSTGSFQEEGTIRLDQSDFAGFLGSHGGTSTGGGQLI